ncbi:conserved hypothetical protein [Lebetimonas natsushimae]|uniref:diguanylate cyclase n=1 Tax=Lebetimonas natsushimae TaxID=1936991 RepID=A0A292YGG0_9BACT|nr:diguanylate cyclase [Lebetimonas natsushimae]GAX87954.1 conserved hypothetical protein [Lebetimonas natsushimae]
MQIKKYKKELINAVLLYVILMITGIMYFSYQNHKKIQTFEKNVFTYNSNLLHTAIKMLNQTADIIFLLKINNPEILSIMAEANENSKKRDALRKNLFKKLAPAYKLLKKYGIRQLHFHLVGNISFLRFHKPDKFGDLLHGIRYSVDLVNKTKKILRGFEEGRVFNGFRNIYPLFYHKKFVGTVEISYSIKAIAEILQRNKSNFYGILLNKKIIDKKVWKEHLKNYRRSIINPDYFWDQKALNSIYAKNSEYLKEFEQIEKIIRRNLGNKLFNHHAFIIPFYLKHKYFIAIFHPLQNIEGKFVGYIVSIQKNDFYAQLKKDYILTISIFIIITFFISILFFLFLKQERIIKENLSFYSNHDSLTKLLNRRGFDTSVAALEEIHKRNKLPFSILFIDIDHFKKINDKYGHDIGDKVLSELANILKSNLRKSDLIARWGGEEFIVILANTDKETAEKIAEKLRLAIEQYHQKNLPHFTVSIGIATADKENFNIDNLLKKADEALYAAKKSGRNRVVFKD